MKPSRHPTRGGAIVLAGALAASACGGGGGSGGGGGPTAFPILVRGAPSSLANCAGVLASGDTVTLSLVGTTFAIDEFAPGRCDTHFSGRGAVSYPSNPGGTPFDFQLDGEERCDEITKVTLSDIRANTLSTAASGGARVSCAITAEGLLGAVVCTVDDACAFKMVEPVVLVLFDVEAAVAGARR